MVQTSSSGFTYIMLFGTLATCALTLAIIIAAIIRWNKKNANLQLSFSQQMILSKVELQERIFEKISNEIHDNVGQNLSLAKIQISIMERNDTLDRSMLKELKESIGLVMTDLRDIANSLSSERIKHFSLVDMSRHELNRLESLGSIHTTLQVFGSSELQEQHKLAVFRIIQESLQNTLKHSHARNVELILSYNDDHFKCDIVDDGTGFDAKSKHSGLGLQNIVNRAKIIGGTCRIYSKLNNGTRITITLPYA